MAEVADRRRLRRQTERWFVRRGLPQFIQDYSVTEDVFTRMVPLLSLVLVVEVGVAVFGDRYRGWSQAFVTTAGMAAVVGGVVLTNRLRRRPLLQRPDDVSVYEILLFVVIPPALALVFDGSWREAAVIFAVNVAVLLVTYVVAFYGLVPMVWFGLVQLVRRLRHVSKLFGRSLPVLLLFVAIIFLTAEVWQVAHDFTPLFYVVGVGSILAVAFGFVALRAPGEISTLERFADWHEVCALADVSGAPLAGKVGHEDGTPPNMTLNQRSRRNVSLLLTVSYGVQVLIVGVVIGVFFCIFGFFAIREETLLQWTTQSAEELKPLLSWRVRGDEVILTWEHLAVSGFVSAFSALQFAVSLLTDPDYRDEFYSDVAVDIRQVLAVRALYLDELVE
jgi:hypothetical protein